MKLHYLIIIPFVLNIFVVSAQNLHTNFKDIAIQSVGILRELGDSYCSSNLDPIGCKYYIIRVLPTSNKKNIEFYIERIEDSELAMQLKPDYYISYKTNMNIFVLNDSKMKLNLLPVHDIELLKCDSCYIQYMRTTKVRLAITPTIYHFSVRWVAKDKKIEIDYCYTPFPFVSINNRPVRKYVDHLPQIRYDTIRNPLYMYDSIGLDFLKTVKDRYRSTFHTDISDSLLNRVRNGKRVISLKQ
jgi:hypothetical protein